jgi:hypothetical protein
VTVTEIVTVLGAAGTTVVAVAGVLRMVWQHNADRLKITQLEQQLLRARTNRVVRLERYVDESLKWRRELRDWMLALVAQGAIDTSKIDMETMPMPPLPPLIEPGD